MAQNALMDFLQGASNSAASTVSAPVDALAWLMRKAGVPIPQAPIGGSDWMAQRGLTAQPRNALAGAIGESAGVVAPMIAAARAPQIANSLLQAQRNAAAPNVINAGGAARQRGLFIGPQAKTWNSEAAAKAQAMEQAGASPRDIWRETGTFKGADGAWRQEIDDSASALGNRFPVSDWVGQRRVGWPDAKDVVNHPAAFGAYPDVASIKTMPDSRLGSGAAYSTGNLFPEGRIDIGDAMNTGPVDDARSKMLHELQHAIQQREGWARGGSPEMMAKESLWAYDTIKSYNRTLTTIAKDIDEAKASGNTRLVKDLAAQYQRLMSIRDKYSQRALMDPMQAYQRLAGEAEARATQARMPLNALQRRDLFPFDSYDVPVDQLIMAP